MSRCAAALISLSLIGLPVAHARELSLDERVAAQKAIEQVYQDHRIWPGANPGPKPQRISDEAIRVKVEDYLKKSNALETWWRHPITADQLQAELDRMSKHTLDAGRLQELYRALGSDPFVIAETLARPALVDRLIRSWYSSDGRFHDGVKAAAEAALARCARVDCMKAIGGNYHEATWRLRTSEGERGALPNADGVELIDAEEWASLVSGLDRGLEETGEAFVATAVRTQRDGEITTASVVWPKRTFDSWWTKERTVTSAELDAPTAAYTITATSSDACINDTWADTLDEPAARDGHHAVWTGSEMIVWGGVGAESLKSGGRYNPATDTWTPTADAPGSGFLSTAVWTGTEMIVFWGTAGSRYNPSSDAWVPIPNIPTPRTGHTAVWSGTEMIVWGGFSTQYVNTGSRYNPATNAWTATSTGANVPAPRNGHQAVWAGTEMIIYGGQSGGPIFYNGGRYVPATDTWVPMTPPQPTLLFLPSGPMIWTGSELIIWGGVQGSPVGGRYHPSTDSWTQTSITANTPSYRNQHKLVWTGTEMIVWGGNVVGSGSTNSGGRYSPATDSWTPTSTGANVPSARLSSSAVWTDSEMIVWGGSAGDYLSSGGRYNPSTNSWIPTRRKMGVPIRRSGNVGVWTGAEMIVWGGRRASNLNSGGRYDPATDSWTATSQGVGVPNPRSGATVVWTGTEMIVWGGGFFEREGTGGRYNPSTDTWAATSTQNSPSLRNFHTAVWTGTEMIIWGGADGMNLNSGGRYNPVTDLWTVTSTGVNTPLGRVSHAAVWTGTEMIVWGGNRVGTYLNTGGRYSPATDAWAATSTGANVPQGRQSSTAVWTGTDMIVWGGRTNFSVNTGGRYNAATDTWAATSTGANVPAVRDDHTAVWTGAEMIVWGGDSNGATDWNTGGRYDPQTDGWLATSTGINVPTAREGHSAVWTGAEMIVWGGDTVPGNPGMYCACPSGVIVYRDADGDGYGSRAMSRPACDGSIPAGYAADGTDCNDASAGVHPGATEGCDALDNDCDGTADNGGSALCNDGDVCTNDACGGIAGCSHTFNTAPCDDGILCTNGDTCSAGSCAGTSGPPPELHGLSVNGHVTTTLSWVDLGGGTVYDVVAATLADLRTLGTSGATCQGDDAPGPSFVDPQANPAPGAGYYYLIRAENVCGVGDYGFDSAHVARVPTADCP